MGIPISGASYVYGDNMSVTYVYGDNMSVVHNTSKQESTLKKMCNAIAYHAIHESVEMGKILRGHIRYEDYPADLSTILCY